jgi:tetratricopeptide (TPR) repeat protein
MNRFAYAAAFAAAVLGWAVPANADWYQANSKHFTVYADENPADLKKFAEQLERFDAAVRVGRGVPDVKEGASSRVTLFVMRDLAAVREIYGDANAPIGGFYLPKASGSVAFVPQKSPEGKFNLTGQNIFFHEYTHHLMFEDTDRPLPQWVSEGFAEFFASPKFNDDGSVTIGAPPLYRAQTLYDNFGLPLDKMLSGNYLYITLPEFASIYGRGWLLTDLLTFDPHRRGQLTTYLNEIQSGVPALKAAQDAFGDLKQLDRELNELFKKDSFTVTTIPAEKLHVPPISIRPLTPAEADDVDVMARLARGESKAHGTSGKARSVADKFPTDAHAQSILAQADVVDGDPEGAAQAANQALQLNPQSLDALVAKGEALLDIAKKNPAGANWDAVREPLLQANKVDPEAAQPLLLFYRSYVEQGVHPTKNAVDALSYAVVLAPQDNKLRMQLVKQLIDDNQLEDARKALATIAFSPHQGKWHDATVTLYDALSANNQSLAKEKWDAAQKFFKDD